MPDPERLVARSVSLLKRLGFTEREACLTIVEVAITLHVRLVNAGDPDQPWLLEVGLAVLSRLARLPKPDQQHAEVSDGNRGGSRAGSTESTAG